MLAIIPILMILIGLVMYVVSTNPKVAEIGRLILFSGLLAFAFTYAGKLVSVIHS